MEIVTYSQIYVVPNENGVQCDLFRVGVVIGFTTDNISVKSVMQDIVNEK